MEKRAPRWALGVVVASAAVLAGAPLAGLAPAVPERAVVTAFAAATVAHVLAFMALGAEPSGGPLEERRWVVVLGGLGLVLAAGFALVLALPPADPHEPALWLGLPPRAAVAVYGIGLLPVLLVPLGYAWAFPRTPAATPRSPGPARPGTTAARGEEGA